MQSGAAATCSMNNRGAATTLCVWTIRHQTAYSIVQAIDAIVRGCTEVIDSRVTICCSGQFHELPFCRKVGSDVPRRSPRASWRLCARLLVCRGLLWLLLRRRLLSSRFPSPQPWQPARGLDGLWRRRFFRILPRRVSSRLFLAWRM